MCPPNVKIVYFFSSPLLCEQFIAEDQQQTDVAQSDSLFNPNFNLIYSESVSIACKSMTHVNVVHSKQKQLIIDKSQNYKPLIHSKPRTLQPNLDLNKMKSNFRRPKIKQGWNVDSSMFREYKMENEFFLQECIEMDI